jgi:hypothetical protein
MIHFPAVVPTTYQLFSRRVGWSIQEHSSHVLTKVIGRTYESHTGLHCQLPLVWAGMFKLVQAATHHFPSHFSHILPIAVFQLTFNHDIAGNIPIPGCRRHISKSTTLACSTDQGLPADLYDVLTIASAHVFPSRPG